MCPECGLGIEWDRLFSDRNSPGYIESEESLRTQWLLRTHMSVLRPWRLWRWIRMEVPLRPMRLAWLYAFALFVWFATGPCLHFAIGGLWGLAMGPPNRHPAYVPWVRTTQLSIFQTDATTLWNHTLQTGLEFATAPVSGDRVTWSLVESVYAEGYPYWIQISAYGVAIGLMFTLYMLLSSTRSQAKVSMTHVLRACLLAGLPLVWAFTAVWAVYLPGSVLFLCSESGWISSVAGMDVDDAIELLDGTEVVVWLWLMLTFAAWFGFAGSRYMKIKRPWTVAILHSVAAALLALFVTITLTVWLVAG